MVSYLAGLSEQDVLTLARVAGYEPAQLATELRHRPWLINDLLLDDSVIDFVTAPNGRLSDRVSPFLLFAVLIRLVAEELHDATYVNDWTGPRSRLPVFDVAPLQEFLEDPGRMFFLVAVLSSFAVPEPPPVPADPFDLSDLARWLEQALPRDRANLLRRLGDLSLLMAGIFPDRTGSTPMRPLEAERLGRTAGMKAEEMLALADAGRMAPGLEAFDSLGSRWYEAAASEGGAPPVVADVASRFRSARRVLNHLTDRHLYRIQPHWNLAV
ncbi:MAG TPA: hypothetical protein VIA81_10750 [Acidimicrobiia bacterium]